MKLIFKEEGSFTVEATLIIPFLLFMLVCIFNFMFYLHDRVVLSTIIDHAMQKGVLQIRQPTDFTNDVIQYESLNSRSLLYDINDPHKKELSNIKSYIQNTAANKLFSYRICEIDVTCDYFQVEVNVLIERKFGLHIFSNYMLQILEVSLSAKKPLHDPTDFARMFDNMQDVVSDIKGYDKVINFLQNVGRR